MVFYLRLLLSFQSLLPFYRWINTINSIFCSMLHNDHYQSLVLSAHWMNWACILLICYQLGLIYHLSIIKICYLLKLFLKFYQKYIFLHILLDTMEGIQFLIIFSLFLFYYIEDIYRCPPLAHILKNFLYFSLKLAFKWHWIQNFVFKYLLEAV